MCSVDAPPACKAGQLPKTQSRLVLPTVLLFWITAPALVMAAERPTPLAAPQGAAAKSFLDAVSHERLQTAIRYMPPDAPLTAEPEPIKPNDGMAFSTGLKITAWLIVIAAIAAAFAALVYWRGMLGDLIGKREQRFAAQPSAKEEPAKPDLVDADLVARLRAEHDPRIGLRLILQRFLDLAARDNALPVKRSLTTRELMQRLPGSWKHRHALEIVAERTELVVFGGRDISREAYDECLRLATPFLQRVGRT